MRPRLQPCDKAKQRVYRWKCGLALELVSLARLPRVASLLPRESRDTGESHLGGSHRGRAKRTLQRSGLHLRVLASAVRRRRRPTPCKPAGPDRRAARGLLEDSTPHSQRSSIESDCALWRRSRALPAPTPDLPGAVALFLFASPSGSQADARNGTFSSPWHQRVGSGVRGRP